MTDPFNAGFWEGAELGELRVQRCDACGRHQLYGRPFCLACGSEDVAWVAAAPGARLHSATEVHVPVAEGLEPPYRVGLVELVEGPRLLAFVADDVAIGDEVVVAFCERAEGPPLPRAQRV